MTLSYKAAGAGIFVAGLLIPVFVHPFSLSLITSGSVCILGGFVYISGMTEEEKRRVRCKGFGGLSLRQITLFIVLMCVFVLGLFILVLEVPLIAVPFFVAICAIWIALMYWVYFTNR